MSDRLTETEFQERQREHTAWLQMMPRANADLFVLSVLSARLAMIERSDPELMSTFDYLRARLGVGLN